MNHANGTEISLPMSASCPEDGFRVAFALCFACDVLFDANVFARLLFFFVAARKVETLADQPGRELMQVRRNKPQYHIHFQSASASGAFQSIPRNCEFVQNSCTWCIALDRLLVPDGLPLAEVTGFHIFLSVRGVVGRHPWAAWAASRACGTVPTAEFRAPSGESWGFRGLKSPWRQITWKNKPNRGETF